MRDRVSACLIVKDEPRLERAVASIRPYVDEIVIVDTGSTDGTAETAAPLADRFEAFTACNFPDGSIADFSAARARSFELASSETVLWLDADDIVNGAGAIAEAIAWCHANSKGGQPWRARFPYAYDHDASGACISWQLRERIVHPKSAFRWVYRVHEGLTCTQPSEWLTLDPPQPITWRHDLDRRKPRSRRNLRILEDVLRQAGGPGKIDLKTAFDLGAEYAKSGDHMRAMVWLAKYVAESDLDDDRVLACMLLVDVLSFWPGNEQSAAIWAHKAAEIRPGWAEGYWALAKLAYAQAARDKAGEGRHLRRVVHFMRKGLECEPTRTAVATNPLDRTFNVQAILADALSRLGDFAGARAAAAACCAARPDDPGLMLREREFALRADPHPGPDIVIACGVTAEAWDPWVVAKRGIGGSETAVVEMAKRLAATGARVRVYCNCDRAGLYDGVEYRPMGESGDAARCDLLIAWRNATLLETTPARVKWLWLHDTDAFGPTAWNLQLADSILCLSEWHARHVAEKYPAVADRIAITRNGIDLARFSANAVERNRRRAIYSSSPDRGLPELLAAWPRVREGVPDAELHVFYAMPKDAPEIPGIVYRGRVDQKTLAAEMLAAGVWVHPSWAGDHPFCETSCIGAMEAQAAGMLLVCSGEGALAETARGAATFVGGDAREPQWQELFAGAIVEAMTADAGHRRARNAATARARFSWDPVADEWDRWLREDLEDRKELGVIEAAITSGQCDVRPTLHMILAPQASGSLVMDPRDGGHESHGGGSRAGFMGLVAAMAGLGRYRVRAFSTFRDPVAFLDGVEYIRLDALVSYPDPDIALAFYDTSPLANYGPATLRIASHHTYSPYMHFDSADVNTAPSDHAMAALREQYDPTGSWYVLPNAVGEMPVERRPVAGRIIYHTSPDRGLDVLLRAFPAIRAAVPHATLHVVGPVREMLDGKDPPGRSGDIVRWTRDALAQAGEGVKLLGRLPRADLLRELGAADVFAFPCAPAAPCETFSISVMECLKAGLPVVLAPADALGSIYEGHARMAPAPARRHVGEFAEAVIGVLRDDADRARLSAAGRALGWWHTFERSARKLDAIIHMHRRAVHAAAE